MHANHFDDLLRALSAAFSRRSVLGGLAALSLTVAGPPGVLDARKKRKRKRKKEKIKRNDFGCVNVGGFCKNSEQCCSGVCDGKKGKKKCQAHDAGICQADQDVCAEGFPAFGTVVGLCFRTTGRASFCGQAATCIDCQTDAECQAQFGPGAACVVCGDCQNVGNTGCSAPGS